MIDQQIADAEQRLAELSAFASRLYRVRSGLSDPAPDGECGGDCGRMVTTPPALAEAGTSISCALSRDDLGGRTQQWREVLDHARSRRPLGTDENTVGLVVGFANDAGLFTQLAHLIAAEQHCCSFYTFALRISADHVVMEVRAPRDAQPLMTELFGAAA